MFKNHKLEVKLVKDDKKTNEDVSQERLTSTEYIAIAEVAATRLGVKLLIGAATLIVVTAVVGVLANAADTALENALSND